MVECHNVDSLSHTFLEGILLLHKKLTSKTECKSLNDVVILSIIRTIVYTTLDFCEFVKCFPQQKIRNGNVEEVGKHIE